MAGFKAGDAFVEILPEVNRKEFEATLNKALVGVNAELPTVLKLTKNAVPNVIKEANTKLAAGKLPKLFVELDIDDQQRELFKELQVNVKKLEVALKGKPIEIPVDLDEESVKAAGVKAVAAAAAVQGRIDALIKSGLDERSLINARAARQRELIELRSAKNIELVNARSNARISRSRSTTLRLLRNDLNSFDLSSTRLLRRLTFGFGVFTAGVASSFAAISVGALRSFAETETQIRRTAAVLGTAAFTDAAARGEDAFAAFRQEVNAVNEQLEETVNTAALRTVFDPTETARGARALAQAGAQITDIKASLLDVAKFAQNEEILPEAAVQQLVQGATAAGMSISEINSLADKFTFVANNTTASAKEVADAFANRAAPAFRAYGQSVDQTLTVLNLFAAAGIKGKTAGEQAGILIREINKAATKTPDTIAAFKKYGIQVVDANNKTLPFTTTLFQLSDLFEKVRKEKGSVGLARLRKELGLTEKSGAGLIQILPQIADLQLSGLQNVTAQIRNSRGAVERQSEVLTRTLSFQTEQFGNQITALFKTAAGPLAKGLTGIFLRLNGEIAGTVGITDRLSGKFQEAGERIAKTLLPSLRRFAFGGEGEAFIRGIRDLYAGTLVGLRNSFIEFRRAAFGDNDGRGFFSLLGSTFSLIGDFARSTLPRIGRAFGAVAGFISENERLIKSLIVAWGGTLLFSKTLRLAVIPASNLLDQIGGLKTAIQGIAATKFVVWLTDSIRGMRGLAAATKSATAATIALSAAQASTAATGGISAAIAGAGIGTTAAAGISKLAAAGARAGSIVKASLLFPLTATNAAFDAILASFGKVFVSIGAGLTKLKSFRINASLLAGSFASLKSGIRGVVSGIGTFVKRFTPVAAIVAAVELGIGAIRGFVQEINRGATGSGQFAQSLNEIKPVLAFIFDVLKAVGKIVLDVSMIFVKLGASIGRFVAGALRQAVVILASFIRGFKEIASGNILSGLKSIGAAILQTLIAPFKLFFAFVIDIFADLVGLAKNIPGLEDWAKNAEAGIRDAAEAMRDFGNKLGGIEPAAKRAKDAMDGVAFAASKSAPVFYDARSGLFVLNRGLKSNYTQTKVWSSQFLNSFDRVKQNTQIEAQGINNEIWGITSTLDQAGRQLRADFAAELASARSYRKTFEKVRAGAEISPAQALESAALAGAAARQVALGLMPPLKKTEEAAKKTAKKVKEVIKPDPPTGDGDGAAGAITKIKTAAEQATEAVNKLSQAQLNKQAGALVAKVTRAAAKGYQATAYEAEILRRTLPVLEAQLQRQQEAVSKLDQALQDLQSTQLKGTKAFSDQAFAVEQGIKKLQLQRLDLIIAGTPEEDSAIKALDDQINKLQQSSERLSLVESLKLDPLRRKLEETFNPVKELTFDQIIKQFNAIQKQRAPLTDAIAGGENLKATLETAIKDAEARFGEAGRQVTAGFAIGIKGATPQVTQAGKTAGNAALVGVNNVMKFGSPSRTMIERGLWVSEGFVQGINAGSSMITSAGVTAMFSFLTGMRNVYENRIQPFIRSIAVWIKENKGPVSYDATLLRPAGEAMMQGFHRGLRDGFNEVKTWVSDVGPDLARHTIPDKIFKKMSAEFLISNASADMAFDPGEFFASITPMGEVGVGANFLGQSLGLDDTIKQAQMIARMFGITPNISSARRRFGDPAYNAAIGGAANSLHIAGRAMDFTGSDAGLTNAANWARKYMEMVFQEVLWKTSGHYDHLHLGWKYGNKKLIADIAGASRVVEEALANAANLTKVDFNLLAAIAKAESGFNPNVVSSAGAGGLMQLMPGTARSLGVTNVFDPKQNALGGAKYIKQMLENFNGNTRIALAAYNAGPGNAMIAMRQFGETIAYIEKVMRYFNQFKSGNYRAQGGKVNSMTPYIVGERGQELFVPSQNGSVISNKDLRDLISALSGAKPGAATGTTINDNRRFEVISNSTDPATVAALVDARIRSQVVGVRR